MPTVLPMIITSDLERLRRFYVDLLGAEQTDRTPADGPAFYVGLRIGDGALGLVHNDSVDPTARPRVLLSIDVADVDSLLARVEASGGHVSGPANDMPWGQRVAHITDPDGIPVNLTQTL